MTQSRRKFITTIATAGASLPILSKLDSLVSGPDSGGIKVRLFSKPLDKYDFSFACECIKKAGLEGFDLTVRPGGRVEPASVETSLPELIGEAKKYNLTIDMIVTGIVSASDPLTERVLKTASEAGVKYYRLGWFEYDANIDVWTSLQKYRTIVKDIAVLNRKFNIHGGYQNHSGQYIGAPVWDLYEIIRDLPVEFIGSQYDVYHATVEGTNTWIIGMRLIAEHIKTFAVKDFTWQTRPGKPQTVTVPLGEGMVDWDLFFKKIKEYKIPGPVTLHVEYPLLDNGEEKLTLIQQQEIIVRKLKKDMDFLNKYLDKYNLA
jgi:L-ribulose-5-phosphate 3-epimerase